MPPEEDFKRKKNSKTYFDSATNYKSRWNQRTKDKKRENAIFRPYNEAFQAVNQNFDIIWTGPNWEMSYKEGAV